jgi:hypothetical protein
VPLFPSLLHGEAGERGLGRSIRTGSAGERVYNSVKLFLICEEVAETEWVQIMPCTRKCMTAGRGGIEWREVCRCLSRVTTLSSYCAARV